MGTFIYILNFNEQNGIIIRKFLAITLQLKVLNDNAEVPRSESSRFKTTLPASGPFSFPVSGYLTATVIQDDHRVPRLAVMSAASTGSSKAAHSDGTAKKKKGPGALATAYLVIYNVVMTAG